MQLQFTTGKFADFFPFSHIIIKTAWNSVAQYTQMLIQNIG